MSKCKFEIKARLRNGQSGHRSWQRNANPRSRYYSPDLVLARTDRWAAADSTVQQVATSVEVDWDSTVESAKDFDTFDGEVHVGARESLCGKMC